MTRNIGISVLASTALLATTAAAQTTTERKVTHDTRVKDGVTTDTTKVVDVSKRKTRQPNKVLGVKVSHETHITRMVRKTLTSSNGDSRTEVKTSP